MIDANLFRIPETLVGAIEVMNGLHGVDADRIESLKKSGYDPVAVQRCVNAIYKLWEDK